MSMHVSQFPASNAPKMDVFLLQSNYLNQNWNRTIKTWPCGLELKNKNARPASEGNLFSRMRGYSRVSNANGVL